MSTFQESSSHSTILKADKLQLLFDALLKSGWHIIGPVVEDQAIVYDEIEDVGQLPKGWTDLQRPGEYRLKKEDTPTYFKFNASPHSWKKFLHPPKVKLFSATRTEKGFSIQPEEKEPPKNAFFGVLPCDLKAVSIQNTVFLKGSFKDTIYKKNHDNTLIIATNCTNSGGTCFCTSMGAGPEAKSGFDLCLTEMYSDEGHYFYIEVGSAKGQEIADLLPPSKATKAHAEAKASVLEKNGKTISDNKFLDTNGLKEIFQENQGESHWREVGERCLNCANCTMACPTCFCTTIEDVTDLTGDHAERWRRWDSCFTMDFSFIHGGFIRPGSSTRYRHWITHKLANWQDQFGEQGCVGCGRCITWCPAGIDIVEEAIALRKSASKKDNTSLSAAQGVE